MPAKFTDWPGATRTSEAGLVIVPVGGMSVGVFET